MRTQPHPSEWSAKASDSDVVQAFTAFSCFYERFGEQLYLVQGHLQRIITMMNPSYAVGYQPWHDLLENFIEGVEQLSSGEILEDPLTFLDALQVFTLESASYFLRDACISAGTDVKPNWDSQFHDNMKTLVLAYGVIRRYQLGK